MSIVLNAGASINGEMLLHLDMEDLLDLGVGGEAEQKKLLKLISKSLYDGICH